MGALQVRLFVTYLVIIGVTLSLTALSLLLLLGGYRDSITYGSLEDLGRLLDSQAQAEIRLASGDPPEGGFRGSDLLLVLRAFVESRAAGGVAPATSIAVVDSDGTVLPGLWAGPGDLEDAHLIGPRLDIEPPEPRRDASAPLRCRLDPPSSPPLLCVTIPLSEPVRATFPDSGAAALVVAEPAAGLGEVLGDLAPRLAFSGLIGVAAALLLGFLLSQSVAAPLRNIARAARNVSRGNFRQRVPATGPTEVRDLAANFNRMTEEVQRSQQTLRDFLANISHELKTPLTSIRGFSQAMLDGTIDSPEGREQAMRVIGTESDRVLRLVEELLALSRLESGQLRMRRDPLQVDELLAHVREVFALRAEESGVTLRLSADSKLMVEGDFDRLEQVLNNLLDNALRHTPAGGEVILRAERRPRGMVEVTVTDSGPGIGAEHLPHLFERFYRASDASHGRGYGLGLAISREIVRAHGGEIGVVSEPGRGTTFSFTVGPPGAGHGRGPVRAAARGFRRRARQ